MNTTFIRKYKESEDVDARQIDHFEQWLADESYFKDYNIYNLLRNEVLIRVYKYTPALEEGEEYLLDEHGVPYVALKEILLPLAKVIQAGPKCEYEWKPGDLVALPDAIALRTYNHDYLQYVERQDERPIVKGEHPPVFVYGLDKWTNMVFVKDKVLGFTDEDALTFIIPETLIRTGANFYKDV